MSEPYIRICVTNMISLEEEFKRAFRSAGYGNVEVEIEKIGLGVGYATDTEMSFLIRIKKPKLTKKNTSRAANKLYKIVRRKKSQ